MNLELDLELWCQDLEVESEVRFSFVGREQVGNFCYFCQRCLWSTNYSDRSLVMMYLQIFTNPSHGLAHVCYSGQISCRVRRLSRVLATPPSSILLQLDESKDLPKPKKGSSCLSEDSRNSLNSLSADSLLRQTKTVGIIGGVSTDSTLKFVRKLVDWSSKDGKSSLPFVLCSDPALNKELLLYDENSYPSLYHRTESTPVDPKQIVENLRNKRRSLERCGAKLILMPCHIAHTWYEEVCEGSSVPLLHMGECIAKELEEAKMKPLEAGNPLRVGVMATSATLSAGFYQERLQSSVSILLCLLEQHVSYHLCFNKSNTCL